MRMPLKEVLGKNVLLIILLSLLYSPIVRFLSSSAMASDKVAASAILTAVSMISVIACFGNFAFTYEKVRIRRALQRYLAHCTTGLLMLIIGITLIMTHALMRLIAGRFMIMDGTLLLLYLACVCYDVWDVLRAED